MTRGVGISNGINGLLFQAYALRDGRDSTNHAPATKKSWSQRDRLFLIGNEQGSKAEFLFWYMVGLLALGSEFVGDFIGAIGPFARRHPELDEPQARA